MKKKGYVLMNKKENEDRQSTNKESASRIWVRPSRLKTKAMISIAMSFLIIIAIGGSLSWTRLMDSQKNTSLESLFESERRAYESKDWPALIKALEEIKVRAPGTRGLLYRLANSHLHNKNPSKASDAIKGCESNGPVHQCRFLLVRILTELRRDADALAIAGTMRTFQNLEETEYDLWCRLAVAQEDLSEFESCHSKWKSQISNSPKRYFFDKLADEIKRQRVEGIPNVREELTNDTI